MPTYPCDLCQEETAMTSVSDMTTGDVKFIGPNCLPLMGLSFIAPLEAPVLDAVLKELGYQPSKATRDARRAAEAPEVDPSRVIAEITEDQPRPPDAEPTSPPVDSETSPQIDKSTITSGDAIRCNVCGLLVIEDEWDEHLVEHPDQTAPPY